VSEQDSPTGGAERAPHATRCTSGDNSVDGVDNSVTPRPEKGGDRDLSVTGVTPESGLSPAHGDADGQTLKGSDLARAALEAARASAKARGKQPGRRSVVHGGTRRRRRWSGPRADDRDPQPLGRLASRIASDRGWTERLAGGQVFGRWAKLVGEDVAEHARPIALSDGELTVQAASTAWATQLRLLQRQLLARIAAGVGDGVVKRLKVLGPAAPSWRYGPRHVPGRGPRDTYG
jgi:predicted nucleic acid-binding Zn ribbon protein